jgi:hypothetical protein
VRQRDYCPLTAAAEGTGTKLTIDHDSTGVSGNSVTITLKNIAYTSTLLAELIANGNRSRCHL